MDYCYVLYFRFYVGILNLKKINSITLYIEMCLDYICTSTIDRFTYNSLYSCTRLSKSADFLENKIDTLLQISENSTDQEITV